MPRRVILTVVKGRMEAPQYAFEDRAGVVVGRDEECPLRVPDRPKGEPERRISRHHCFLEVSPPQIRVRDFGSRNGTYVNGEKIGQREAVETPGQGRQRVYPERDLQHGDEIGLAGAVTLRVEVELPAYCAACGSEVPGTNVALEPDEGEARLCPSCVGEGTRPAPRVQQCALCGKAVGGASASTAGGICEVCRSLFREEDAGIRQARDALAGLEARYTLLKQIGKGSTGVVHLARRKDSGELVAIKLLLPDPLTDPEGPAHFLRQVECMAALEDHPHVVRCLDSGTESGLLYLVMDYCNAGSLQDLLPPRVPGRERTPVPPERAIRLLLPVLHALEHAHSLSLPPGKAADGSIQPREGLIHRDLKPANILLHDTSGGTLVKVGDWGLARALARSGLTALTKTGDASGTYPFMARVQYLDFKYARQDVDVWAAAATLYYMLTLCPPRDFPPDREPHLVMLEDAPVPIRQREPAIPAHLAEVIDAALLDRPKIGISTARELRERLERVLKRLDLEVGGG